MSTKATLNSEKAKPTELDKATLQANAMTAFHNIRAIAESHGFMSDEEIEAEIQAYRKEKQAAFISSISSAPAPQA